MSHFKSVGNGTVIEVRMFESEEALAAGDKDKSKLLGTTGSPSTLMRLGYTNPSKWIGYYIGDELMDYDTAWFRLGCTYGLSNGFPYDANMSLVFADPY